jgi:hypothetical protein
VVIKSKSLYNRFVYFAFFVVEKLERGMGSGKWDKGWVKSWVKRRGSFADVERKMV